MYDPRLLSTTPCTVKTFSIVGYNVVVILVRLFFYTTNKMCYISTRSFDKNGFDALSKKKKHHSFVTRGAKRCEKQGTQLTRNPFIRDSLVVLYKSSNFLIPCSRVCIFLNCLAVNLPSFFFCFFS